MLYFPEFNTFMRRVLEKIPDALESCQIILDARPVGLGGSTDRLCIGEIDSSGVSLVAESSERIFPHSHREWWIDPGMGSFEIGRPRLHIGTSGTKIVIEALSFIDDTEIPIS